MLKPFHIWVEGYAVTGSRGPARKLTEQPIMAENFDDAVRQYMASNPDHGIEENGRGRYSSDEDYQNRSSNWNIWACNLYDNETDARRYFG